MSRLRCIGVVYFLSSAALVVLNKIAITVMPNATVLLLAQIVSSVFLISSIAVSSATNMNFKPSAYIIKSYAAVAAIFLASLYSSFRLLHSLGVNHFIVLRCSTPLIISVLDWCFLRRELPGGRSIVSLIGILFSGTSYSLSKMLTERGHTASLGSEGAFWSTIWLVCFSIDIVYIKHVIDKDGCSSLERTLYQNLFSIPFLLVLLAFPFEKTSAVEAITGGSSKAYAALLLSCFAGTLLSYSGMFLRSELSATYFTVLGVLCKMGSCALNEFLIEREKRVLTLLSVSAAILCSAFFSQAPLRKSAASVAISNGLPS